MKVTGERVASPEGGFNPTWQRHVAAYALAADLLPEGRTLDLGCGVGHSFHLLTPRETVGVDISPEALADQRRATVVADMRELPFGQSDFEAVLSVQSLEHVPDPQRVLGEVARVLDPDGVAMFVTPNRLTLGRPGEIIDPYHYVEFDSGELHRLCERSFGDVEVLGLFGSPRYMELFDEERATLDRVLAMDPLRLRLLVPIRLKQWLYDAMLRRHRRDPDPRAAAIEPADFELRETDLDDALDVCAVCREPYRKSDPDPTLAPPGCAWCGAELGADAERLDGRTRCARCGAATTDPWPSGVELATAYGDWYRPPGSHRFSFAGDAILGRTRGLLAGRIDEIAPPGPVLDVGAGDGTLLDALRARGREATGLERTAERADFLDEALADVRGDGEWAAIILWHSLEHLPEPGAGIRHAARLLKPGGLLAIAVPNNASLQARAFGDDWLHLDLPRHLVHLSGGSLRAGLEREGFEIGRVSYARGGQIVIGWLDGLVGRLPGGLSLYQALRRRSARFKPQPAHKRLAATAAGILLLPVAAALAIAEISLRRGGTVYVESRRV